MDTDLNLSSKGSVATPYDGVEAYLNTLEGIYKQFDGQVCGIAMSVPGGIDSKNGICIFGGSLLFIDHLPLVQEMEKRCHVPVSIMNDGRSRMGLFKRLQGRSCPGIWNRGWRRNYQRWKSTYGKTLYSRRIQLDYDEP